MEVDSSTRFQRRKTNSEVAHLLVYVFRFFFPFSLVVVPDFEGDYVKTLGSNSVVGAT